MATNILSNKLNTSAVIHVTPANTTLVVAGNSSVSNVATGSEVLTGASIRKVAWGVDTGSIQLLRGANVVAVYTGTNEINYNSLGMPLTQYSTANIVVNFVGTSNGYILMEVAKQGTNTQ